MTTYTRTEQANGLTKVTSVTEDGEYTQCVVWPDGSIDNVFRSTLAAMGWDSLHEFLASRKGFKKVCP